MATLSASTWGNPNATTRVLLIHGITNSSQYWHHIAQEFVSRGYFVVAPDLLGHGTARRSTDYTIAAFVEDLRPMFTTPTGDDHPFHIVVGQSLGGVVAAALLPLLKSSRPTWVVLSDPPLELTPASIASYKQCFGDSIRNPKTPEGYLEEHPSWTREDAVFRSLSVRMYDATMLEVIFDQNAPCSFSHYLANIPDNVHVTVLVADPSKAPCVRLADLEPYPRVTAKTVWGASHSIPLEFPLVIVETALEGTEARN